MTRLDAEPLYHASRGSKELFHSDILAWFVRTMPQCAVEVFGPWLVESDGRSEVRVRREHLNLDLVIELPGFAPLVIENKAFALPDEAQLAAYARGPVARLGAAAPSLVLLSLQDPGWGTGSAELGGRSWRWVSYGELGTRLDAALAEADQAFDQQVARHEAEFLQLLHRIMTRLTIRDDSEPFALSGSLLNELRRAGLADAVGKARAHQVMRRIHAALLRRGVRAPARELEVGFTRGRPLLSGFWEAAAGVWVGWQYQDRQWRLAMILSSPDLFGRGKHPARAEFALAHHDFFDFTRVPEIVGVPESALLPRSSRARAGEFNKYDPDFLYRYRVLPERVTVGEIVDLAVECSSRAADWFPSPVRDGTV
ncbi:hypothetical protein WIS52_25810 [Pseudonocardia nematodicida]|uniref:PD-(D/E)XK nuclease superfamily protein n=1 Tax=Pseudonocardia nematodicida TaxID=1206997 RepID=A0ABV1KHI2_9PSEU